MTTDKKTLADVQPGGRVRLGDQALSTSEGARRYVADFFATQLRRQDFGDYILTELAADFACALAQHLSAQPSPGATALGLPIVVDPTVPPDTFEVRHPSPGGQDALHAAVSAIYFDDGSDYQGALWNVVRALDPVVAGLLERDPHAAYEATKPGNQALAARQPVRIYGCCAQPEGELHTAECPNMRHLAARQPVGEAIGEIVYSGEGGLQIEFYDGKPLAPMKLYAAPPAQAVDLAMPIAMIDQALGHLSTALDDLDSSPDPRPGAMVTEAMACLRQALTGGPNG
ncbi:hypothetical protein I5U65_22350 [Stenotrophomonas maltophilia]|nr:hypothetical protein [Stenotrophomonas maltophilia]